MSNFEETLKEVTDTCSEIRHEINSDLWPELSHAQKAFSEAYNIPLSYVKNLHQAWYYRDGGYPKEDSPPRFDGPTRKVAEMILMLSVIGKDHYIKNILSEYGITFHVDMPRFNFTPSAIKTESTLALNEGQDIDEHLEYLLDVMSDIQRDICEKADSIKIDSYEGLNAAFPDRLKKGSFVKLVNTKAKEKKNVEKALEAADKIRAINNAENEALDVVMED